MKIFFDSSAIVDIERKSADVLSICRYAARNRHNMILSVLTVSEILTGAYLMKNEKAVNKAKEILLQFDWIDIDSTIAEETAKLLSYQISTGRQCGYQDTAILACFRISGADYLITSNPEHFKFPFTEGKIFSPLEFVKKMRIRK